MTDGEDTPSEGMKPSGRHAPRDGLRIQPRRAELLVRHDTALTRPELIRCAASMAYSGIDGEHRATVARKSSSDCGGA